MLGCFNQVNIVTFRTLLAITIGNIIRACSRRRVFRCGIRNIILAIIVIGIWKGLKNIQIKKPLDGLFNLINYFAIVLRGPLLYLITCLIISISIIYTYEQIGGADTVIRSQFRFLVVVTIESILRTNWVTINGWIIGLLERTMWPFMIGKIEVWLRLCVILIGRIHYLNYLQIGQQIII